MELRGIKKVHTYSALPVNKEPGVIFFVRDLGKVVRWDEARQSWQLLDPDALASSHTDDRHNDRRGAILAQKAK